MSILHSKQGTGEATAALLHDVLRLADMLQLMWKQLKARRWRKTDICAVLWLHAQGQQALILNLNLCLNRLTACVWHVYSESDEENSSCVCVCVCHCLCVCAPASKLGTWWLWLPPPVVVAPVRTPLAKSQTRWLQTWASNPSFLPLCACVCASFSANLPVKTCFVSLAQHYTCYPRLNRLITSLHLESLLPLRKRFFVSVYTPAQVCTPFVCVCFAEASVFGFFSVKGEKET